MRYLPQVLMFDKLLLTMAFSAEPDTAAVAGMAGAGVANSVDGNAIRRSPASMLLTVDYTGQSDFHGSLADGPLIGGTVSVKDTRTSDFGAGIQTTRQWSNVSPPENELPGWKEPGQAFSDKRWEQSWRLGFGYGVLRRPVLTPPGSVEVRRLAFGGGGVYTRTVSELSGNGHDWEFNAGVAARPHVSLTTAASVHGLGEWGDEAQWYEAGAFFDRGRWQLATDGIYRPSSDVPVGFRGGAGVTIDGVTLRGGGSYDEGEWLYAGGLGIVSDTVRADYGLQYNPVTGAFDHYVGFFGQF